MSCSPRTHREGRIVSAPSPKQAFSAQQDTCIVRYRLPPHATNEILCHSTAYFAPAPTSSPYPAPINGHSSLPGPFSVGEWATCFTSGMTPSFYRFLIIMHPPMPLFTHCCRAFVPSFVLLAHDFTSPVQLVVLASHIRTYQHTNHTSTFIPLSPCFVLVFIGDDSNPSPSFT
jgi:hypothetical protein